MHTGFFLKAFLLAVAINSFMLCSVYTKNSALRKNPSSPYIYFNSVTPEEKVKIEANNHIFLEGLQIKRVIDFDKYLGSAKLI